MTTRDAYLDANGKLYPLPQGEKVYWRISGYAIARKGNEILMVVPSWSPLWELPGGGIEEIEEIGNGIKREFYEETGYDIKLLSELPLHVSERNFYHRHEQKYYHSVVMIYEAEIISENGGTPMPPPEESDEIRKIEWVFISDLNDQNCHPTILPAITHFKKCHDT